jgi:hypothetical protein
LYVPGDTINPIVSVSVKTAIHDRKQAGGVAGANQCLDMFVWMTDKPEHLNPFEVLLFVKISQPR